MCLPGAHLLLPVGLPVAPHAGSLGVILLLTHRTGDHGRLLVRVDARVLALVSSALSLGRSFLVTRAFRRHDVLES